MARCNQIESDIQSYIDGELTKDKQLILEEHLAVCPQCRNLFDELRKCNAVLYEVMAPYKMNESIDEHVMKRLPEVEFRNYSHIITLRAKHQEENRISFSKLLPYFTVTAMLILGMVIFLQWPRNELFSNEQIGFAVNLTGKTIVHTNTDSYEVNQGCLIKIEKGKYVETLGESKMLLNLPANTIVKMGNDSRLKIVDGRTINVEKGVVWFDVGKDKKLFKVQLPQSTVTVFGTQFQVEVTPEKNVITVARGEVTVEAGNQFIVVRPNQQVFITNHMIDKEIKPCDSALVMAWANEVYPSKGWSKNQSEAMEEQNITKVTPEKISEPASQVFIVPIQHRNVSNLVFYLDTNKLDNTSNFTVYASDDELRPLFRYRLTNEMLRSSGGKIALRVPNDANVSKVKTLHIEIVSDEFDNTNRQRMPFTKVFAQNIEK